MKIACQLFRFVYLFPGNQQQESQISYRKQNERTAYTLNIPAKVRVKFAVLLCN
jgi:hypothetical protein